MATAPVALALKMVKLGCNIPFSNVILPIIGPIITLPGTIIPILVITAIIRYATGTNWFNKNKNNEKSFWSSFKSTFMIYYLLVALAILLLFPKICELSNAIPDIPGVTSFNIGMSKLKLF